MERGWWLHSVFAGCAKRCMAWEYMLAKAAYAPHLARLKSTGKMYHVHRGQFVTSLNDLTAELSMWGFTKQSTRTLLIRLEDAGFILRESNTHKTIITICNYESLQSLHTKTNTRPTQQSANINTENNTANNTAENPQIIRNKGVLAGVVENINTPSTQQATQQSANSNTHINRTQGIELNINNTPQTPKGAACELFLNWFELLPSHLQAQKKKCQSYWNKHSMAEEAFKIIPATKNYIQKLKAYQSWKDRNPSLIQETEKFKSAPFIETLDAYTLLRGKWAAFVPTNINSAEEFNRLSTLENEHAEMLQEIENYDLENYGIEFYQTTYNQHKE